MESLEWVLTQFSVSIHEFMHGLFGEYRVNIEKPCKNGKAANYSLN